MGDRIGRVKVVKTIHQITRKDTKLSTGRLDRVGNSYCLYCGFHVVDADDVGAFEDGGGDGGHGAVQALVGGGGIAVGDEIKISLDLELVRQ